MATQESDNINFPEIEPILAEDNEQENTSVTPQDILSGVLPGNTVIQIGSNNIKIDGANRRIIINDGTTDRVIIGFLG